MAVAFDAISAIQTGNVGGGGGTVNFSHTPSGTPTGAILFVRKTANGQITGVTYGGEAMSLIGQDIASGNPRTQMWGLASPPSGAQTVAIAIDNGADVYGYTVTVTGSHATTASAFTSFQSDRLVGAAAGTATETVTSQTDDLVIDFAQIGTSPATDKTMTEGADQTERQESYDAGSGINLATSTKPGAASVSMSYSWASSTNVSAYTYLACNIVQAAAVGGRTTKNTRAWPLGVEIGMNWRGAA